MNNIADAEFDDAEDDFEREHRYAQAALQRKRVSICDGMVMRYEYVYDQSEYLMCDKVWIDRLTGKEVMRYDVADPANTNSYYGACPDEESFVARGLDIYAQIDAASAKLLPQFSVYDDGRYCDYDD